MNFCHKIVVNILYQGYNRHSLRFSSALWLWITKATSNNNYKNE